MTTKINPASFRPLYPCPLFSGCIWSGIWNGSTFKDITCWCIRKIVLGIKWLRSGSYPSYKSIHITRITHSLVLKETFDFAEANNLCFIRETTSIPVPRVYDAWEDGSGRVTVLMEWVDAVPLTQCWEILSPEEKSSLSQRLRQVIDELRDLPQPPDRLGQIGPPDGSQIYSPLIYSEPVGPFSNEKAFNEFLLSRVDEFMYDPGSKAMAYEIRQKMREDHRIIFTHGDISARNILIDKNANLAAIIDWETAGWMPSYWEYVTTINLSPRIRYWISFAEQFVYADEEAMQTVIYDFVPIRGQGPW